MASDIRKIVTIDPLVGTVTTVLDLNDEVTYFTVRDSFGVEQGDRGQALAATGTRYGGADVVSEASANDTIKWQALVSGASVDAVLASCDAIMVAAERSNLDTYIEFRAGGATNSTYYLIRGPGTFQLTHDKIRLENALAEYVDLSFPVAPLAHGALVTQTISSTTMPAVVQLGTAIGGNAPAKVDIATRWSGAAIPFCLYGWAKRPTTPLASSVAPFGIIEAETGGDLATWAAIGTDTDYRGSNGLRYTATSGVGSASATYSIDPSTMQPDDFTRSTVDIEVWARIELAAGITAPRLTASLEPHAGTNFGAARYTPEFGSAGRLLANSPLSGTLFRPVRLGTLTMPVDTLQPLKWKLKIAASWTGGAGVFGLDYLVLVPARRRACTRSGAVSDSTYPNFVASSSDTNKLIRSDLSGMVASGSGAFGADNGMGGSPIEFPPGNVDLVVWPSTEVPDDPTLATSEMAEEHTGVTGTLYITPRYYVIR